jgi:hypothetical protein
VRLAHLERIASPVHDQTSEASCPLTATEILGAVSVPINAQKNLLPGAEESPEKTPSKQSWWSRTIGLIPFLGTSSTAAPSKPSDPAASG